MPDTPAHTEPGAHPLSVDGERRLTRVEAGLRTVEREMGELKRWGEGFERAMTAAIDSLRSLISGQQRTNWPLLCTLAGLLGGALVWYTTTILRPMEKELERERTRNDRLEAAQHAAELRSARMDERIQVYRELGFPRAGNGGPRP